VTPRRIPGIGRVASATVVSGLGFRSPSSWLRWVFITEEARMNIPKPLKLVLLALTLWVPIYMVWFVTMGMGLATVDWDLLFALHTGTMAVSAVLMIVYIVHLFKAPSMDSGKKALWGITLFCGAPIAMPIYFFAHIWPAPAPLKV
jgi:hypothetical protein